MLTHYEDSVKQNCNTYDTHISLYYGKKKRFIMVCNDMVFMTFFCVSLQSIMEMEAISCLNKKGWKPTSKQTHNLCIVSAMLSVDCLSYGQTWVSIEEGYSYLRSQTVLHHHQIGLTAMDLEAESVQILLWASVKNKAIIFCSSSCPCLFNKWHLLYKYFPPLVAELPELYLHQNNLHNFGLLNII